MENEKKKFSVQTSKFLRLLLESYIIYKEREIK